MMGGILLNMRVYSIENDKIFYCALSKKMQLIYDVGCSTGLRISDIVRMKKEILNIKEPTIKEQKTGKTRRIYFKKNIRERLFKIAEKSQNDYIFFSNSKTGHISRQAVWKAFKNASKSAEIKHNVGTQSMRKKYAYTLKKKHSLKYIQNKLNHDNIMTSLIYCTNEKEFK